MPIDGEGTVLVVLLDGREIALGALPDDDPFVAVEAIARIHLAAKRRGVAVRVQTENAALRSLLDSVGLGQLACAARCEPGDQAARCSGSPKYGNNSG